ncbi:putative LOC107379480-like protein [Nothobranchius furzeri]|uniref:LOC107379480-like protein n=1 Tax=Nothobranchius furzeri TaxID=105023 RepID=A0A9D3C0P1_NOTFU|nr:putative LOC107379480-like protein [Nothobranchius furzeri]
MKTIIWFGVVLGALAAAGKVFIAEVGMKKALECGNRKTITDVQWNHGSEQICKVDVKTGRSIKGKSNILERSRIIQDKNLQIRPVKEMDAGRFTCIADGATYEHTLIVVSVSVNPSSDLSTGAEASLECRVTESDQKSTVKWEKPGGLFENSPKVQLSPVEASHGGPWQCHVTNGAENFSKTLMISVKEADPKLTLPVPNHGNTNIPKPSEDDCSSRCKDCSTNHQPPSGGMTLLGLIWWVWVAVGVGSLVVIILIIVVIVMMRRIRRRKRKLLKMRDAKLPPRTKKYCQCERQTAAAQPQLGRRREKPSAQPLRPLLME